MKNISKHLNLLHFLNDGFFASMLLLLPFIAEDIEITLDEVGVLAGVLRGLSIVILIPIGALSVRFSSYKVILFSLAFYSFGFFGVFFSSSFFALLISFVIAGIGFAPFHPLAYGITARLFKKGKKGKSMGNLSASGETGKLFMTFAATTLVAFLGWRFVFMGYAVFGFNVFLFLLLISRKFIPQFLSGNGNKNEESESRNGYRRLLKEPGFLLAASASSIDYFASGSLYIFLPFLLLNKGFDIKLLGVLTGVLFIGNILGKSQLARFVDKHGYLPVLIIAEGIMAGLIILLVNLNSFFLIVVVIIILGVFTKGTGPVLMTLIGDSVDHLKNYEKAFSLSETINSITGTLSPLLYGVVGEIFGIKYVFTLMAGFALLTLLPAVMFRIKDKD